ncbi:DUF4174 domain-containing protein [Aquimonas sp.]|uniref:DUF4174 domain-containing protein n=1 Tax=Aquimonas sp. TaxID=1872588 RepID=UPI0037BF11A1
MTKFMPLLVLLLSVNAIAATSWLDSQQWQRRLIIVTALDEHAWVRLEHSLSEAQAALRERRLSVWQLQGDRLRWSGGAEALMPAVAGSDAAGAVRDLLGERAHAPGLHLIGLDGGLKASRTTPEQLSELLDVVDSMPMRLREGRREAMPW